MKKFSLLLSFVYLSLNQINAQCVASASVDKDEIACNECVTLTGQGNTGSSVFTEDFNSGTPTGWAFTQSATYSNPCSPGPDGTPHLWMGNTAANPRDIETVDFDLTLGGTICFDMLYAAQGGASPCEGPDLPSEGVYLQYSTDGGTTWVTISYNDPLGGNDPNLTNWNNYCYPIPAGALTPNTRIRFHQDAVSGVDFDHWGIDNVSINLNDPALMVSWLHDGYNYGAGNTGGTHPTPQCSPNDTSFILMVTNGTVTCYDTVDIKVKIPTLSVTTYPSDTAICEGDCFQIRTDGAVILDQGGTRTYENKQPEDIGTGIGGYTADVDLNVQGLNMTNVLPNSIQSVCITGLESYRNWSPFGVVDINDTEIELFCPSGGSIILVPDNVTTGGGALGYNNGYLNTCFVPAGPNINTGTVPYTGNFQTNQSFNGLAGCTANGVWTMRVRARTALGGARGTLEGWSITFNDTTDGYPGLATWNHGTWLSDPSILEPTVCPLRDTSYIITVTDSNNCVTATDTVNVTIAPVPFAGRDSIYTTCSVTPTDLFIFLGGNPAGGGLWKDPNGVIVNMPITPGTNPNGDYEYIVSNIAGCNDTAVVTLTTGGVNQANLLGNDTSVCSNANLQLTVNITGANYNWNTGATTNSIPAPTAGTYWVEASQNGCTLVDTIDVAITPSPFAGDDGTLAICNDNQVDLINSLQNTPDAGGTWYISSWTTLTMPFAPYQGTFAYVVANGACADTSYVTITSDEVTADYIYNPITDIYYGETDVDLQENATNAQFYQWFLDGTSLHFGQNYTTNFNQVGVYEICLDAYNTNCHDTICKFINVIERTASYVPNTFTPDGDGKNDEFTPFISGEVDDYEFRVFNRWGNLIFFSNEENEPWNGTFNGAEIPSGVYIWRLEYKIPGGSGRKKETGHINLLR